MERVVYPIFPSFSPNEKGESTLELKSTIEYIKYIDSYNNIDDPILMTTAGSSQFNLLSSSEIRNLNDVLIKNSHNTPIVGIPSMSLQHAKEELDYYNTKKCYPMFLYPDRFYTEDNICEFFEKLADYSENPIYIHGMWLRKGNGGTWDFTSNVINRLSFHENIKGIKEETSSLEGAYNILKNLNSSNFDIIVAGGSMKRHWYLMNVKNNISFLSGIGSIYPNIPIFYNNESMGGFKQTPLKAEKTLFDVFMEIGWHGSIRYALQTKGFIKGNREPFIELDKKQKREIDEVLMIIENKYKEIIKQ